MIVLFQLLIYSGMPFWHYLSHILATITAKIQFKRLNQIPVFGKSKLLVCNGDKANVELKITPPLADQKYLAIQDILINDKWRKTIQKAVEYGNANLHFFKHANIFPNLNVVLEVDINRKNKYYGLRSFKYYGSRKLNITLYAGSIKDPDIRLFNADLVLVLDTIEFLYPNILEALPYNIFEFIKPPVVIISTSNADLKHLFPRQFPTDPNKKFVWTREQFMDWAYNITTRFPDYIVYFDGIGTFPINPLDHVGAFMEVAIFYRVHISESPRLIEHYDYESYGICSYCNSTDLHEFKKFYNEAYHPMPCYFKFITNSFILINNEKDYRFIINFILHEVAYKVSIMGNEHGTYYNYSRGRSEIPVTLLHKSVQNLIPMDEFILLLREYYALENRLFDDTIHLCVIWCFKTKSIHKISIKKTASATSDSDWETISMVTSQRSQLSEMSLNESKSTFLEYLDTMPPPNSIIFNRYDIFTTRQQIKSADIEKDVVLRKNLTKSSLEVNTDDMFECGDYCSSEASIASDFRPLTPILESRNASSQFGHITSDISVDSVTDKVCGI